MSSHDDTPYRVPIADEKIWETYRPRDYGNRRMGALPIRQVVWNGVKVPEGHFMSQVDTRKGGVPRSPAYKPKVQGKIKRPRFTARKSAEPLDLSLFEDLL